LRLVAVLEVDPRVSGGVLRAARSIRGYAESGIQTLFLRHHTRSRAADHGYIFRAAGLIAGLERSGARYCGSVENRAEADNIPILRRTARNILASTQPRIRMVWKCNGMDGEIDAAISMHEDPEIMSIALAIAKEASSKSIAILQLPPFYGDRERLRNIERANMIWARMLGVGKRYRYFRAALRLFENKIYRIYLERLLKSFDLLIPLSRSIPLEMGVEWSNMRTLDPGYNLDREDLELIHRIRESAPRDREDIVLFTVRVEPSKGVIEALYAFKLMARRKPGLRLAIIGRMDSQTRDGIFRLAKKLGIFDKVVLKDYLPRDELFRLRARSKLLLYPSHEDSFSYTVLESLYLGVPVVGYDIPALRINHLERGASGISLVKEFDVVSMAEEGLRMIDDNVEVSPPNLPSWDEIIYKENEIIKSIADN
jgi:glycosyltransferase involved in cell wall biosynthesis